jgi:Xaa-Pro aminopeptidase
MVVTVEPGVYLAGETGARVEDTILITTSGREVFDTTTRDLLEL